jgi:hypothetical protein
MGSRWKGAFAWTAFVFYAMPPKDRIAMIDPQLVIVFLVFVEESAVAIRPSP